MRERTLRYGFGFGSGAVGSSVGPLRKAGVPSYFVTVKGAGHGDFGNAANDRVAAFFARYLLGKDVEISTKATEKPER